MTLEQTYESIKAQFIELSRAIHLGYNTYDPLFTIAADAVRSVCKAEPIEGGARRNNDEYEASVILTAIMKTETNITDTLLSKMMLKKAHGNVGRNMKYHWLNHGCVVEYSKKFDRSLELFKAAKPC